MKLSRRSSYTAVNRLSTDFELRIQRNKMTNHQTLNSYIINNTKLSNRQFQYKDVLKIANEVLVSSLPGKSYATLKFLQVYCTPVIEEISEASSFRHGDPRNFEEIDAVKKNWFFRMSNNNELTIDAKRFYG